jgi:hypothetical protein
MSAPRTHRLLQNQHDATPFVGASGRIVCKATRVEGRARSHICRFHMIALEWIGVAKHGSRRARSHICPFHVIALEWIGVARAAIPCGFAALAWASRERPAHAQPSAEPARRDAIRRRAATSCAKQASTGERVHHICPFHVIEHPHRHAAAIA